jgi:hypothetical protein
MIPSQLQNHSWKKPTLRSCVGSLLHGALMGTFMLAFPIFADQIVISGIAQPGVEFFKIENGGIVYLTAAGTEVNAPLSQVDGVCVDRVPQLEQGDKALAAGEAAKAVTLYQQAMRQAGNVPWLQQWIAHRLVAAQDTAGQGAAALETYATLVTGGADAALVADPPIASVSALSDAEKQRLLPVIERLRRNAPESLKESIEQLAQAVAPTGAGPGPSQDPQSPAGATTPTPASSSTSAPRIAAGESAVRLPAQLLVSDNPVMPKLQAGLFADASKDLQAQLEVEQTRLADRLFLLGVAELGVADRSGRESDYLDAALSFMKVAIYYPSSNLAAPALLEAGYAHRKAGLDERAEKLIDEGRGQLDEEAEPAYARWLSELSTGR